MAYPGQFHRLVMIGTLYTDVFNMTLNIVPSGLGEILMPEVTSTLLEAVADDVEAWFPALSGSGGCSFISAAELTSIKLNRIDSAGHYADEIAQEYIYPAAIAGGVSSTYPAQLSTVATLGTRLSRGRGSKGRMYLLPNSTVNTVGADGRITAPVAEFMAQGVVDLINALNGTYALVGRVGVASKTGAGSFEHVTKVGVGRVVDTMRSRRSSLVEDHQFVDV